MLESRQSHTVLDDERSNEIGNEGGASCLVFFGMQVELAFGARFTSLNHLGTVPGDVTICPGLKTRANRPISH